ncbi:peptidase domain-containing ABC transporter [Herbaspirillum sp. 1130]|uniref:peptidase domain-containing ABC transporter n=1 Tax=Herbaspirillum sp. 1130 TaxID=2806562 RepID=UPI001AE142F5|nr:peptidase domain-containing ABC transporter [Herbaspirillum sp. 1130]MBP1318327.1 ATP-binding cassette subfamily B protein RaxB [Herbaspirillum sp. 1130]
MASLNFSFRRGIQLQLQTEAAECGLACLAMIATAHGHEVDLRTLRQRFSTSLMGITLAQLARNAQETGFVTRPLKLDIDELKDVQLPCIMHMDMNHFVVLSRCHNGRFEIFDPASGHRYCQVSELNRRFTGVVLELIPDVNFKRQRKPRGQITVFKLLGRVLGLESALAKIFLLSAVIEVFALIGPFLNQWAIDEALVSGDAKLLYTIIVGFVMVVVMQTITEAVREFALIHLSASLSVQWYTRVLARLIRLPLGYFEKRQLGAIIVRLDTVATIQTSLSNGFIDGLIDGVMAIGTFLMMALYSMRLALISAGILSLYVLLRLIIYRIIRSSSESYFVFASRFQTYLMESIRGIQTIKLFCGEGDRLTSLTNRSIRAKNATLRIVKYSALFRLANSMLFRIETVTVLALGGLAVMDKSFTVGMLVAFTSFREQFARRISSLVDRIFDFRMLSVQTERLADIMLEKPESLHSNFSVQADESHSPLINVDGISYRYGDGLPEVISNISFSIDAGEHVVIIGPSGCGKTTLLKLLTGLFEPTKGTVSYGGVPISLLGKQYRSLCATVTQDDVLFAGSIAENITFFDEHPDHELTRKCAAMAGIEKEILAMPMGFDTLIGDMGSALSGGQKQRVLLARAFYKKPKVLFLDEATSHLDSGKEFEILKELSSLKITRIVIAHRKETINSAERIINLPKLQSNE